MSTPVRVLLNVPPEQVPQAFVQVCQRLFSHTDQVRVERFSSQPILDPQITNFTTDLAALVEAVQPSDERLEARAFVTTPTRKRLLVEVRCTGRESASFRELGALSVAFDTRDLIERKPFSGELYPLARVGRCQALQMTTLTDIEALFFRIIGWCPTRGMRPPLRWAAIDWNRRWRSPDGHLMVYHPTLHGFVRDLTVAYIHHHWGLEIPPMMDADDDLLNRFAGESWETSRWNTGFPPLHRWAEGRAMLAKSNLTDVDYENRADHALGHLAFLDDLNPTVVRQVEAMDEAAIDQVLTTALTNLPQVRRYSLAGRGTVLAVDPPFTLWPVYAHLAQVVATRSASS